MHVDARVLGLIRSSPACWHQRRDQGDMCGKVPASDDGNATVSSARADQANMFVEEHADCRPSGLLARRSWESLVSDG